MFLIAGNSSNVATEMSSLLNQVDEGRPKTNVFYTHRWRRSGGTSERATERENEIERWREREKERER